MSRARNMRRANMLVMQSHYSKLAAMLGDFVDFLSSTKKPADDEVRERFISDNLKWKNYCKSHELVNMNDLFITNVREIWHRHQ